MVCVRRGRRWQRGLAGQRRGVGGGGGRWYTLVPVSPLIKSSLNEPEGEHTHTHMNNTHTHSLTHTDILGLASFR